jgi:hypothetical protein
MLARGAENAFCGAGRVLLDGEVLEGAFRLEDGPPLRFGADFDGAAFEAGLEAGFEAGLEVPGLEPPGSLEGDWRGVLVLNGGIDLSLLGYFTRQNPEKEISGLHPFRGGLPDTSSAWRIPTQ